MCIRDSAYLASYLKYAQPYNEGQVFVNDPKTGQFLLARDFVADLAPEPISLAPINPAKPEYLPDPAEPKGDSDTAFHQQMHMPLRLTLPGDETKRAKRI